MTRAKFPARFLRGNWSVPTCVPGVMSSRKTLSSRGSGRKDVTANLSRTKWLLGPLTLEFGGTTSRRFSDGQAPVDLGPFEVLACDA
jgi:hypothetical protein